MQNSSLRNVDNSAENNFKLEARERVRRLATHGAADHLTSPVPLRRTCTPTIGQWILKALFFLIFSTIKFMFEGSDLGPNFFNHVYACRHYFTSRCIIFWKSNAAREKDLIFCDGSDKLPRTGTRKISLHALLTRGGASHPTGLCSPAGTAVFASKLSVLPAYSRCFARLRTIPASSDSQRPSSPSAAAPRCSEPSVREDGLSMHRIRTRIRSSEELQE